MDRLRQPPSDYAEATAFDGGARRRHRRRHGGRGDLAARTSAALHRRHLGAARGPDRPRPLSRLPSRRGGQYTYHGPGQRVVYVMLDIWPPRPRRALLRRATSKAGSSRALAEFSVRGEIRDGRVGVWVARPDKPPPPTAPRRGQDRRHRHPPAPLGVASTACRSTSNPTSRHFAGIVPCGIRGHGVTSLVDLGLPVTMADLDAALRRTFDAAVTPEAPPARSERDPSRPARTLRHFYPPPRTPPCCGAPALTLEHFRTRAGGPTPPAR